MTDLWATVADLDETMQQRMADGAELAAALKREARRRADAGTSFGHISYMSVIARRPA